MPCIQRTIPAHIKLTARLAVNAHINLTASLAVRAMWAGNGTLHHAEYYVSFMQQTAALLRVSNVIEANKYFKEISISDQ